MCGITGFIDYRSQTSLDTLQAMRDSLAHRGPDDADGVVVSLSNASVGLAHRRLSVLELSSLGHQPMHHGNLTIVFNGEIYNYQEVRDELTTNHGHVFHTNSDTEVILHAFEQWGLKSVDRFIGMFAFVILDRKTEQLFLCRDRLGVKPLYCYLNEGLFLFSSELKAMHQHPRFRKAVNPEAVSLYMQYGYVPGPRSIFENTWKLPAGHWCVFDIRNNRESHIPYWSAAGQYQTPTLNLSYEEALAQTHDLLRSAVSYRMVSDVPVGVFLSSGFDSTLVTALMQECSGTRAKTFTIGFPSGVDESPMAGEIASILQTDHTSYNCTEREALDIIPDLPLYFDEPCDDVSCIPTILVSRLARKKVTVALSGDGGDEFFAGYNSFRHQLNMLNRIRRIPGGPATAAMIRLVSRAIPARNFSMHKKLAGIADVLRQPRARQLTVLAEKASSLPVSLVRSLMKQSFGTVRHPFFEKALAGYHEEESALLAFAIEGPLTDQLLVKVDRSSMSASLEAREPLLDHRLMEFSARLPFRFKNSHGVGKRILRDITCRYVPEQVMNRPKIGFDLPLTKWLRGDLSFLIDEYLNDNAVRASDCFELSAVKAQIAQFKKGDVRYEQVVWRMLNYQMWYKKWFF
jgi:asparagine synthase (glutamine-hydrolysing)